MVRDNTQLPKAFIFDCDGTLVDSMGMWLNAYPELVARYGLSMVPDDFAATEHLALPDEVAYYHEHLGIGSSAEALIDELRDIVRAHYASDVEPMPGVGAFLDAVDAAGIPMVIATSTDRDLVELALSRLGLSRHFTGLVTTKQAGASKESPAVYDLARTLVAPDAAPEDVWVFEDAPFGLTSAGSAGYRTVGIFDPSGRAAREDVRTLADIFLDGTYEGFSLDDILHFGEEA